VPDTLADAARSAPRNGTTGDSREEAIVVQVTELPNCRKCGNGQLLPLSDYGRDGAPITFKAWVCSNPDCGFNIRIDNGEISFGRALGQSHK
jgi:hypothetical protein